MPTATATKKAVKKAAPTKIDEGSFAVIETGGKQYRVSVGESIKIEKIKGEAKVGDTITFDKVLLTETNIGTPYLAGAKVTATLVEIGRNKKVTAIHYKQKSRYFKKQGHRQPFFKVKIQSIQ